jgi:hypothetical protein
MTENKFELQSYFILYLLFVRILNLSKDIVPFWIFPIFLFVNERVIEKYGRVRCINIFADYGFCVFHLWKSIFNQPTFGTTQWNTPGSKGHATVEKCFPHLKDEKNTNEQNTSSDIPAQSALTQLCSQEHLAY